MNCKNPYIKAPGGTDLEGFKNSKEVRTAITPHPCGQCMACRIAKSREWTIRMALEQTCHNDSIFLTLTYDDKYLPKDDHGVPILVKKDCVDFLKRLRYYKSPDLIRHFAVGEYGNETQRPHFHLCLFGISEIEKTPIAKSWRLGFFHSGELNKKSMRYATGYIQKNLRRAEEEELYGRPPEFMLSSRGTKQNQLGGLGRDAVRIIANNIKDLQYPVREIIRTFKLHGSYFPLGSYLTRKLADDLGIEEDTWNRETMKYQLKLLDENMKDGNYYQNIYKPSHQKALSIEARAKIFAKRRTL